MSGNRFTDKLIGIIGKLGKYRAVVLSLAIVVVFVTTYLLILPAFTLEKTEAAKQGGIDIPVTETAAEASGEKANDADNEQADTEDAEEEADEVSEDAAEETSETSEAVETDDPDAADDSEDPAAVQEQSDDDGASASDAAEESSDTDKSEPAVTEKTADEKEVTESEETTVNSKASSKIDKKTEASEEIDNSDIEIVKDDEKAEDSTGKEESLTENTSLIFESDKYKVVVEDSNHVLPENTEVKVKEIDEKLNNKAYQQYASDTFKAVNEDASTDSLNDILFAHFYDITLISDGKEIKTPPDSVNVRIEFSKNLSKSMSVDDPEHLKVIHFVEDEASGKAEPEILDNNAVEVNTNNNDYLTDTTFEATGFSVYGIVYTVDFHWNLDDETFDYSIAGGDSISFRELLNTLNVLDKATPSSSSAYAENAFSEDDFINNISTVDFSDDSLLKVIKITENTTAGSIKEKYGLEPEYSADLKSDQINAMDAKQFIAPDWALFSLKAFDTEESLTITMKDGERFVINVTDASDPLGMDGQTYVLANANFAVRAEETDGNPKFLKRSSISSDSNVKWKFEYEEDAFPVDPTGTYGTGGYYLYNEFYGKYMKITGDSSSDSNRSITLVDTKEEATPLSITFNDDKGAYRFSNKQDSSSGFLNHFRNNNYFGVSNRDTDDSWIQLLDPDTPSQATGKVGTWDVKGDGITIKLFDYTGQVQNKEIDEVWGYTTNPEALRQGSGINNGRSLVFSGSGLTTEEGFNNFTGTRPNGAAYYSGYAYQGIVDNKLGDDNFPTLTADKRLTLKDRESGGSLAYLFNDDSIDNAKTAYTGPNNEGLDGLLRKDKDGYYYYDSEKNYAHLSGNTIELYDNTYEKNYGSAETKRKKIGFFPFNDYNPIYKEEKGPSGSVYDHQLGMTLSTEFIYPENGKVVNPDTGQKNDMIFEFSGDDDVWVFVDGVLVLDLGGVHQPIHGSINFATGAVDIYEYGHDGAEYKSDKSTTISEMFSKVEGKDWDTSENSRHTFDFFFIERGGCDSNCAIKFNLLTVKTLTLVKELTGLSEEERAKYKDSEFDFELCKKNTKFDDDFHLFNTIDPLKTNIEKNYTVRKDKNGKIIEEGFPIKDGQIKMKDGESVTISYLPSTGIFHVAELDNDTMAQFDDPTASRYYQGEKIEDIDLSESQSHKSSEVKDWVTHDYELADTDKIVIKNTLSEKELTVQKVWADGNDHHTDDTIKFTVQATIPKSDEDPTPVVYPVSDIDGVEFEISASSNWKTVIQHLPAVTPDNRPITYTVHEIPVDGYSSTVEKVETGDETKPGYVIRNTPFEIKVTKEWNGVDPADPGLRESKVTVTLGRYVLKDKAGTITIKKTGVPTDAVFRATYTITDIDSGEVVGAYFYDAEIASTAGKTVAVPPGTFVVTEDIVKEDPSYNWSHTPSGHTITTDEIDDDGHDDAVFSCEATFKTGTLSIKSTLDNGGGPIDFSGVKYQVYEGGIDSTTLATKADGSPIGDITFDQIKNSPDGKYVIDGLKIGKYTVKESGVPNEQDNYTLHSHIPSGASSITVDIEENTETIAEFSSTYEESVAYANVHVTSSQNSVDQTVSCHIGDTVRIKYVRNNGENIQYTITGGELITSNPVVDEQPGNNNGWSGTYHIDVRITAANANIIFNNPGLNGGGWSAMNNGNTSIEVIPSSSKSRMAKASVAKNALLRSVVPGDTSPSPSDYGNDPTPDSGKKYIDDASFTSGNTVELTYGNWEKIISTLPATDPEGNPYYYYIKSVEETNMPEGTTCTVQLDADGNKYLAGEGLDHELSVINTVKQVGKLKITKELLGDVSGNEDYQDKVFKVTIKNSEGKYLQSDKTTFGVTAVEFNVTPNTPLEIEELPIDTYTVIEKTDAGDVEIENFLWNSIESTFEGTASLEVNKESVIELKNYYNEQYTPEPSDTNEYTDVIVDKRWIKKDGSTEPLPSDNIKVKVKVYSEDAYVPVKWDLYQGRTSATLNEEQSGIYYMEPGNSHIKFTLNRFDEYNTPNSGFNLNTGSVAMVNGSGVSRVYRDKIPMPASASSAAWNTRSNSYSIEADVTQKIDLSAQPYKNSAKWVAGSPSNDGEWQMAVNATGNYYETVDSMVDNLITEETTSETLVYTISSGRISIVENETTSNVRPDSATADGWVATLNDLPKYSLVREGETEKYKIYKYEIEEIEVNGSKVIDGVTEDYSYIVTTTPQSDGVTTQITNEEIKKKDLSIIKVDKSDHNQKLSGAVFEMYLVDEKTVPGNQVKHKDDLIHGTLTTDTNGSGTITEIMPGYYEVKETVRPTGYVSTGEDSFFIHVTISGIELLQKEMDKAPEEWIAIQPPSGDNGIVYQFTDATDSTPAVAIIENESGAELPMTGGIGTTLFYLLGSILVIVGGIYFIARRRIAR